MTSGELKIALVGPLPPPSGGMANQTRQLARLLQAEGVNATVVQVNCPYRPRWVRSLRGVRAAFRLLPYLAVLWKTAANVQLFHVMANSGWAWHLVAAPAIWIAKMRGVPVVVNYRGGLAAEFFSRSFFWIKPTMLMADRLIVPSAFLQLVFARFGFKAEIVPNVVDLSRFSPKAPGRSPSVGEEPHIIVTRNLEPIYSTKTALHAFAIVRKTWPHARMTIGGTGPERERLQDLARALGIDANVTFAGRIDNDNIAALYRKADLFLNPSLADNMPISILEALASGVPVVTTNVGGIPFLVEHRKTAILVPPQAPAEMAQAMLEVLGDPAMAARMAAAGRESVQRYTWQSVRGRLFEVYSALARPLHGNAGVEAR